MNNNLRVFDASVESFEEIFETIGTRGKMDLVPVLKAVNEIVDAVRLRGDQALMEYTERFDRARIDASTRKVTPNEVEVAFDSLDRVVLEDLRAAADRIESFHKEQLSKGQSSFRMRTLDGGEVGMEVRPLERVGLYVPGGTAPLPSSVLMNAIPASVVGVGERVMCTPPRPDGTIAPVIIAAAKIAGIQDIYKVGGAQAVAALAYGTETIPKVDKICGPGNIYVNTAKRLVYGTCDIDMFAGPSEILIIADDSANARYVAADMLSQAEHDPLASAVLISTSASLIKEVSAEIERLFETAGRKEILSRSLSDYAALIKVDDLDQAVEFSNRIAPEHLELCIEEREQDRLLPSLKHVGAVFMGNFSPEPLGDYFAGPNHVLPTSGTARFFSPLNTTDFLKKISVIRYDRDSLRACAHSIARLANLESLDCHAKSIMIRFEDDKDFFAKPEEKCL
ncbi:MAG: histidinol dehydrogenase [Fastidiosipilaceae bacterium]|jgi:histidinol dehydrogenase